MLFLFYWQYMGRWIFTIRTSLYSLYIKVVFKYPQYLERSYHAFLDIGAGVYMTKQNVLLEHY